MCYYYASLSGNTIIIMLETAVRQTIDIIDTCLIIYGQAIMTGHRS